MDGAGKSYGDSFVFGDVSFSASCGDAVALVGPNGSGKTTMLKCVAGAEVLDHGHITIGGVPELDESLPVFRSKVAALLDDVDYFPELSVIEHLRMVAWLHGVAGPDARVDELVLDLSLESVVDQLPPTLSSGERHRLGLAMCLVRDFDLLLLDEPEQRLDLAGRRWLQDRLQQEKVAGAAIVFASHDDGLIDAVSTSRISFST